MKSETLNMAIVTLYNVRSDLCMSLREAGYTGDMDALDGFVRLDAAIADLEAERAAPQAALSIGEAAQKVASSIGLSVLKRTLDEGGSIHIPSLGITIGLENAPQAAKEVDGE